MKKYIVCLHEWMNSRINNLVLGKPTYYVDDILNRDILINEIYQEMELGATWLEAIRRPKTSNHGERVAEYAFIASFLKELEIESMLDVGCVMNNAVIANHIKPKCQMYFLNPSLENVIYKEYGYFKFPLSSWRATLAFPLVTCFSTIEHIGFDNTRYGVDEIDQEWDWPRCIEEVVRSVEILLSKTASGGTMVASCPYGREEFVFHPPVSGVRTAQVLHVKHVEALKEKFGNSLEIITLRLSENGWEPHPPEGEYQSYGDIGPGASGLILIIMKK
jgi:hypothetical protein